MGSANLSAVAQKILDIYKSKTEDQGEGKQRGRKNLIEKRGQILVVTKFDFIKGLTSYETYNTGAKFSSASQFTKLWGKAKKVIADSLPKIKDAETLALVKEEIIAIRKGGKGTGVMFTGRPEAFKKIKAGDLVLPMTSYSGATGLKKSPGKLDALLEEYYKNNKPKQAKGVKYKKAGTFWQAGHGQFGIATSQADLAASVEEGKKGFNLTEGESKKIDNILMQSQMLVGVTIKHNVICKDDGTYINEFIPIVSLQDKAENLGADASLEGNAIDIAREQLEFIAGNPDAPGSPTQSQVYESALQLYFYKRLSKNKNVHLNFIGKNTNTRDTSPEKKGKILMKRPAFPIVRADARLFLKGPLEQMSRTSGKKKKRAQKPKMNTAVLLGQINKDLGKQVAGNMGRPGLRNETGRFASSARATSILPGGKGVGLINYTYQKDPYQVFENGTGYPSAFDPRHVIEKSIRELATRQLETKFVLRRV
jgi:hypothetical protein